MIKHALHLIKQNRIDEAVEVLEDSLKKKTLGTFSTPSVVYEAYKWMASLEQEEVYILCLDNANRVLKSFQAFKGSSMSAYFNPRDIMREAVRVNASGVILIHNHPGGSCKPSEHDKIATKTVSLAGKTLEIKVVDHIIISDEGYFSFVESKLI